MNDIRLLKDNPRRREVLREAAVAVLRRAPAAEVPFPGSVEGAPVAAPVASDSAKPVAVSVHQLVAAEAGAAQPDVGVAVAEPSALEAVVEAARPSAVRAAGVARPSAGQAEVAAQLSAAAPSSPFPCRLRSEPAP